MAWGGGRERERERERERGGGGERERRWNNFLQTSFVAVALLLLLGCHRRLRRLGLLLLVPDPLRMSASESGFFSSSSCRGHSPVYLSLACHIIHREERKKEPLLTEV